MIYKNNEVTGIIIALSAAPIGEVRVLWTASTDIDTKRYVVRCGDTSGSWVVATVIDVVDGLRLVAKEILLFAAQTGGVWRFCFKIIDSIFQESTTAATCSDGNT